MAGIDDLEDLLKDISNKSDKIINKIPDKVIDKSETTTSSSDNIDDELSLPDHEIPTNNQSHKLAHLMGGINISTPKFLIADNHKSVRVAVKQMLKNSGYKHIEFAENGHQALKIIKNNMVNFIIAEWDMPKISGIDLLKIIKSDPKYFVIAFLMISGEKLMKRVIYAIEEGADGFILKPFNEGGLISVVNKTIEEKLNTDVMQSKINEMNRQKLRKNYDKALKIGYDILKSKKNARIARITGECFFHKKEYNKASVFLKESLEDGKNSKALQLLGKICIETGEYEHAVGYFQQALLHNPINQDSNIDLIRAFFKQGLIEKANELLKIMMESDTSYLHSVEIGKLYLEFDKVDNIGKYLCDNDPIPETVHIFFECAVKLGKNGQYKESIKILDNCNLAFPDSHFIQFNLGVMYYQIKKYDQAVELFKNTLKLKPDHEKAKKFIEYIKKATS